MGVGVFVCVLVAIIVTVGDEVAVVVFVDVASIVAVSVEVAARVCVGVTASLPVTKVQQIDNPIIDPRRSFAFLFIGAPTASRDYSTELVCTFHSQILRLREGMVFSQSYSI